MNQRGLAPILILILVAFLIGGVLIFQNTRSSNQSSKQTIPQTPETKEESSVNQFTSQVYGYTVNYPKDWETYLYNHGEENTVNDESERFFKPKSQEGAEISLIISKKENTSYQVLEKDIKTMWDERSVVMVKIDGVDAIKVDGTLKGKKNSAVLFQKGDFIYKLQTLGDNADVLEQILSSFKFTDKSQVNTQDWKTYEDSKFGYTVKYPANWENQGLAETISVSEVRFSTSDMTAFVAITVDVDQQKAIRDYDQLKNAQVGEKITIPYGYRIKSNETKFDNYPAVIYSEYGTGFEASFVSPKALMFDKNGTIFHISLAVRRNQEDEEYKEIFEEMLTTFKFN